MRDTHSTGDLEQAVMDQLWVCAAPDRPAGPRGAIRSVATSRHTTVMTVLQRLAKKNLVVQHRDDRAYRYSPPTAATNWSPG